jgi:signal transduction histidine kinase
MTLVTPPPETLLAPASTTARDDWVQVQLVRSLMRHAHSAVISGLLVIPTLAFVLYQEVNQKALLAWVFAALLMTLFRYRSARTYHQRHAVSGGAPLSAFMARYSWTLRISAMVWGASMFLFFRKVPGFEQFISLIVLVGMAGFAVNVFSACWRSFTAFVDGLCSVMLLAMVYSAFIEAPLMLSNSTRYAPAVLLLIYWATIRAAGKRFHAVQRRNLELQFSNAELITSLTVKARAVTEAVATKNRFVAGAAHDLRQSVHALALYADWLVAEPELAVQIAPKILQSTRVVNELFNSLLDLDKLDTQKTTPNWQEVDLPELMADLELQYAPLAHEKGLVLRRRTMPLTVRTDAVLLRRVLGNLLSNAIHNTTKGGVFLSVRRGLAGSRIEVWDTGVGIAPEHRHAIFQEFYRIARHGGTEEGFGLGLAIVSRLCKSLDHPLRMSSRPGRGTVFRLYFKNTEKPGQRPSGHQSSAV